MLEFMPLFILEYTIFWRATPFRRVCLCDSQYGRTWAQAFHADLFVSHNISHRAPSHVEMTHMVGSL